MVHARSRRLLFPCKFVCLLRGKGEKLSPFPLSNLLGCCPVEQPFYLYALLYSWEVCCSTSLQSVLKLERKYTKHLSYIDIQTCEPRLLFRPDFQVLVVLAPAPLVDPLLTKNLDTAGLWCDLISRMRPKTALNWMLQ